MTLEERFWSKIKTGEPDECWEWQAGCHSRGYGVFGLTHSKIVLAHRVAWELTNGPIPKHDSYHGMCVCHKCDNPKCCNPAHLFLGTNKDNIQDKMSKNRCPDQTGMNNGNAKLSDEQITHIRSAYSFRLVTQQQLADRFGVSRGHIGRIIRGEYRGTLAC